MSTTRGEKVIMRISIKWFKVTRGVGRVQIKMQ